MSSHPTQTLEAALGYAARGWHVFPVQRAVTGDDTSGKKPVGRLVHDGKDSATTDPEIIRRWWSSGDWNIGVACEPSGLVILDVDVGLNKDGTQKKGRDSLAKIDDKLQPTRVARTGGGGIHVIYQRPNDYIAGSKIGFADGLDLISNGYIVVAPSNHHTGGSYEWLDPNVPIAPLPPFLKTVGAAQRETKKVTQALVGAPIPEGHRNRSLFRLGCALRDTGIGAEALSRALLAENNERAGLPDAELATIINSVLNTVTPSRDVAIGAVVEQEIHQIFAKPAPTARVALLENTTMTDEMPTTFYTTGIKELDTLLGGGFAPQQVSGIIAPPSSGKSSLVGDLALHLQQFRPVLHCSFELMRREVVVRYAANRKGVPWRDGIKGLIPKEDMHAAVKGVRIYLMGCDDCDRVDPLGTIEAEALAIKEETGEMPFIIVDYVQLLARGSDDKKNAVGELTMRLRVMAQRLDTIILAVFSTSRGFYSGPNLDKIRNANDPTAYLGAAKESGDIEFDCANIFFLDVDKTHEGNPKPARLAVARSRYGEVGFVGLSANLAVGKFTSDPGATSAMASEQRSDKREGDKLEVACVKLLRVISENPTWPWSRINRAYKGTKYLIEARNKLIDDKRVTSESHTYIDSMNRTVRGEFLHVTLDEGNTRVAHDVDPKDES